MRAIQEPHIAAPEQHKTVHLLLSGQQDGAPLNSMQVWPDAVAGLREIRRVMKTVGKHAFAFTRYSGQPKSGLIDALAAAGFTGVRVTGTPDGFCAVAREAKGGSLDARLKVGLDDESHQQRDLV